MVAFSKIFIGLCGFSGKVTSKDLWHLILKLVSECAAAISASARVDVFDILIEAALATEAEALQKVISKKQGEN